MNNITEYYEIQWEDKYECWHFNNMFKTLEEAQNHIKRNSSDYKRRIVKKTEEIIKYC